MKSLIVPVDFSKQAKYALDLAVQIARKENYKVDVLHVVEFPVGSMIDPVGVAVPPVYDKEFLDTLKKNANKRLENFLEDYSEENIETVVEIGNPYEGISEKLGTDDYELIVMGTKGASGFKEFLIGSNTEKVVRTAECPVIAVRDKTNIRTIKNIVFATLGTEVAEDLMLHLKQLQYTFEATIHLVRINTPNNFASDREVKPLLQKLAERHMLKDFTVNVFSDADEEKGIIHFADIKNAEMIAMGTHARKGLDHFLIGSVAEDVVNHAHKLIWTYHIKQD